MITTISKRWERSGKGRHRVPKIPIKITGAGWSGSGPNDPTISVHLSHEINAATGENESLWLHLDAEAAEQLGRQLLDKATQHRDYYTPKVTP